MDDANSKVYSAFFVAEEGPMSSFRTLMEVIEAHGLFCSVYADRGSYYWGAIPIWRIVPVEEFAEICQCVKELFNLVRKTRRASPMHIKVYLASALYPGRKIQQN